MHMDPLPGAGPVVSLVVPAALSRRMRATAVGVVGPVGDRADPRREWFGGGKYCGAWCCGGGTGGGGEEEGGGADAAGALFFPFAYKIFAVICANLFIFSSSVRFPSFCTFAMRRPSSSSVMWNVEAELPTPSAPTANVEAQAGPFLASAFPMSLTCSL